jgi:hypothetical protein
MLWFYAREEETLTLELRYDNDTQEYVATTIGASTPIPQTSRFRTVDQFRAWLEAFDRKMIGASWKVKGSPHILADGWPDKRPPR